LIFVSRGALIRTVQEEEMKKIVIAVVSFLLVMGIVGLEEMIFAAERYPVKPISFIIPIGPGSDIELVMRPWLQKASEKLGKPIIIVHKPGAGHSIGYREIYGARPDGYTIGSMVGSMLSLKLQGLFPYDYHDYTIINTVANMYPVVVASKKNKHPFTNMEEVLTYANSHPGEINIASTSVGSTWWVATMYFQERTGLKFNIIPQEEGAGQAITQVAGGHVDLGICGLTVAKPQIDAGNLRLLGVLSNHRIREPYQYAPTLKEMGRDIVYLGTSAVIGPPKMPKEVVDKLAETLKGSLDADIQKHFLINDQPINFMRSEEALKKFDEEREIIRSVMSRAGLLKAK
jgi:tripartite-type tricarboxylate transporter receptor subunit TctC